MKISSPSRLRRLAWGSTQEREAERFWIAQSRARGERARVLARNFRSRGGEIDWVGEVSAASGARTLVFVETRSRRSGGALESIDDRKRQRIRRAAQRYLLANRGEWRDVRFDAVICESGRWFWFARAWEY